MNIGKKIKALRCEKFMTQSELAGNEITRNMLSRIENGAAQPSLDTLRYLARRLNVSAGFLLAEDGDEQIYLKNAEIRGIKKAFIGEDYRICRDICKKSDSVDDDEIQMILAECNLAIGIEEFNRGNLRVSCEYLDEAIEGCGKTFYRTDSIVATAGIYFRYMRRLSATLSSNIIDEGEVNIYPSMTDEFCRYAYVLDLKDRKIDVPFGDQENFRKTNSPFFLHLEAMRLMEEERYEEAYKNLKEILLGDISIPEPMMYFLFCDLEICCREIQDFRGAYEYSIDKIELLQKLLV